VIRAADPSSYRVGNLTPTVDPYRDAFWCVSVRLGARSLNTKPGVLMERETGFEPV